MTAVFGSIGTPARHLRFFPMAEILGEESAASFNFPGNVFDGQKQLAAFSEVLILGAP